MNNGMATLGASDSAPDMAIIEQALIGGDLSKLTPPQRVSLYHRTCDSIGVNPLTNPFAYLQLNGKLVLYAKRDCTDQLRGTRKISITIASRERMDDVYVVTARATMPDGRTDESTGAVCLTGLKGESLANALMKSETKAKRRVTLSIVGLGLLDESEVDSIAGAQRVNVDTTSGEILDGSTPAVPAADLAAAFTTAMASAATMAELVAIGKKIAAAGLPEDASKPLEATYRARAAALKAAA